MATQVDGPRGDVDVHEVVDDPALNVVLDPVHQVSAAHVEDFNVRQVPAGRRGERRKVSALFSFLPSAGHKRFM